METSHRDDRAVCWAAILAGALATLSLSLILLVLAAGFGVSLASPWNAPLESGAVLSAGLVIWLFLAQAVAGGMGGYLAGRLRVRWRIPGDEVYFRDTAHGFLAWSLAMVVLVLIVFGNTGTAVPAGAGVAKSALWSFAALLAGAFSSSLMGLYGGRQRDAVDTVLAGSQPV